MINVKTFWSRVAKDDGCWNWQGCIDVRGYGSYSDRYAHRIAYELSVGPIPSGHVIDHKCFNRACVNPEHLRPVTIKQNIEHRSPRANPRGTTFDKASGKWIAQVKHNRRTYNLGRYETRERAAEVARLKRLELFTGNDEDAA